ncbi:MAG: hypothetical protein AMS16_05635 [Planctomycetes bacterium DG_58]|nr:MAG: hypothetical protein AMS16_05635 [Planctomycetes bacterium DG_58]
MGKKRGSTRGMVWMMTLTEEHIEELRERLAQKGPLWSEWEYKLWRGNIIIYTPVTPWNPDTRKPDPELRYMCKHLRIVPSLPGPFGLEYWRHTEQWSSLPLVGSIAEIADFIEADDFGLCAPTELPEAMKAEQAPQRDPPE